MELYWYIIVIMFVLVKILFYVCWYRSRQRQLHTYLANPGGTQVVIVGSRAYLHRMWQRRSSPAFYSWYPTRDTAGGGAGGGGGGGGGGGHAVSPAPSYGHLEVPPPYEAVARAPHTEGLKPPPYSECVGLQGAPALSAVPTAPSPTGAGGRLSQEPAPPPYTPRASPQQPTPPPHHQQQQQQPTPPPHHQQQPVAAHTSPSSPPTGGYTAATERGNRADGGGGSGGGGCGGGGGASS